jgi:hypothetical protein
MSLTAEELLADEGFLYIARRVLAGKCILFLGAGASISSGAPASDDLAKSICQDILMTDETYPLAEAAAYADASAGRRATCDLITARLSGLQPSDSLALLPSFPWQAIFSVNFDDLVEKAYEATPKTRAAELHLHTSADNLDYTPPGHVPLYMVHGSYKDPLDPRMGLLLTPDDFITAASQRRALYRKLADRMQQEEVIYIGFAMRDPDFLKVVADLWEAVDNQAPLVPRGYALVPDFPHFMQKLWDTKKITLINATLEQFAIAITQLATGKQKPQPIEIGAKPILASFLRTVPVGSDTEADLARAFDFPEHDSGEPDPSLFFRGAPATWADIRSRIDAARTVTDSLLGRLLIDPNDEPATPQSRSTKFIMITGPAGTGKSTLMRRLAWEVANTWARPTVWLRDPALAQFDLIEYLAEAAHQRLYVFVDNAADAGTQIVYVIGRCRTRKLPVSFVVADRENEWEASTDARPLEPDITFSLGRITEEEANAVLDRLAESGQLGTLEPLSRPDQVSRLMDRAARHLLVALREATEEGRRFDDIVVDEYKHIPSETGRNAYLDVCTLYQFGILTRAGILSRAVGVPLAAFGDEVLRPTHHVIIERQPIPHEQPQYQARHEVVAQIVFRRTLPTSARRTNQIMALLRQLDPGYRDDFRAFVRLVSHNWLRLIGLDSKDQGDIYALARRLRPGDALILQQQALSMRWVDPVESRRLIKEAEEIAPNNDSIKHSRATLLLDDAWRTAGDEQTLLLDQAQAEFERLVRLDPSNPASYVSLAKLHHRRSRNADNIEQRIALLVDAQRVLRQAFQRCPTSTQMLEVAAELDEEAGNIEDAEQDYRRAVDRSGSDPQVVTDFAQFLLRNDKANEAVQALNDALDLHPAEPLLNYALARALQVAQPNDDASIRQAFEYAISEPLRGFLPQLQYAIYLFSAGDQPAAADHFRELRGLVLPYTVKTRPYSWLTDTGLRKAFQATIHSLGMSAVFLRIPGFDEPVFASPAELPPDLTLTSKVTVNVYFNLFGPRAVAAPENQAPPEMPQA